jgi:hypothetical protein
VQAGTRAPKSGLSTQGPRKSDYRESGPLPSGRQHRLGAIGQAHLQTVRNSLALLPEDTGRGSPPLLAG